MEGLIFGILRYPILSAEVNDEEHSLLDTIRSDTIQRGPPPD